MPMKEKERQEQEIKRYVSSALFYYSMNLVICCKRYIDIMSLDWNTGSIWG